MLLTIFIVILAAAGVKANSCQTRFMTCIAPMQSVMSAGPGSNMAEACGVILRAIDCTDEVVTSCQDDPTVNMLVNNMQFDNMRTMCAMYGGDDSDGCPSDALIQLETCMSDMAVGSGSACTKMTNGIQCIESVIDVCQNSPRIQGVIEHIPMDELRENQTAACAPPVEPTEPVAESTCTEPRPLRALKKCQRKLISSRLGKKKAKARCRSVLSGFRCLSSLINRCPDNPRINSFVSLETINREIPTLTRMCQQLDEAQ